MATPNGRWLRSSGFVRAILRLSLLISLPFAAGLFLGVLVEEPELLARHLRGEGEAVVLTERLAVGSASEDAQAKPGDTPDRIELAAASDRERVMQAQASEEIDVGRPAVAARAPSATRPTGSEKDRFWAIQVGAFSDEAAAARLVVGLDEKGYPTELIPSTDDSQRWRVRVQPVEGKQNAQAMAGRLKSVERLPTWVIPMEGRSR